MCAAAPGHPLNALKRAVTLEDLRAHRHLVVRDSGVQRTRFAGWLNEKRWTVSHKATSIHAACMGLGYAWFPEDTVRAELAAGRLVRLPLAEGAERHATLYLIVADAELAGPGTVRLAALLRERTTQAVRTTRLSPTFGARPVARGRIMRVPVQENPGCRKAVVSAARSVSRGSAVSVHGELPLLDCEAPWLGVRDVHRRTSGRIPLDLGRG